MPSPSQTRQSAYDPTGVQYHNIPTFTFTNGTILHDVRVAYRVYNPDAQRGTILIPTCFSGWINTTLTFTDAPNNALATYRVVVAAMLGNGESSSPSNNPFFPELGQLHYEDVIHAHHHLLCHGLQVSHLEAVIGFSMGGQQAYHWPIMYPAFVRRVVGICTSARTSPHNYAFLEGPIAVLERSLDYIAWKETKAKKVKGEDRDANLTLVQPRSGLVGFKRAYAAWLTSAEWFSEKHWKTSGGFASVEDWIQNIAEGALDWDADDLLILARMWQMGDIGKTFHQNTSQLGWYGSSEEDRHWEEALKAITCPVLLMPSRTDQYFRPLENELEMRFLKDARLVVIESVWGHVSGGGGYPEDTSFMNEQIGVFLQSTQDAA